METGGITRTVWIAGAVVIVVLGLVLIALNREPVELDPSTPEGVVQTYLQAVNDDDYSTAFSLLSPDEFEGCDAGDLARAATGFDSFSATIDAADIEGDRAFVDVRISEGQSPGPFDPGGGGYYELFELERSANDWLIVGDPWPYLRWQCEGIGG